MERLFSGILTTCFVVFSYLAGFSGILGGILLIISGEWFLLFKLIGVSIVAPFLMVIPILPSGLFALPGAALLENGYKFVGNFMLWLASIYLGLVFGLWSATVLTYVLVSSSTFWGSIFISFGVAIGPLIYMTSKTPIEDDETQ